MLLECFWLGEVTSWYVDGGPLYAIAKCHDQEIVRALETHPNVYHGESKLNLVWSPTFMCSVKTYATGVSTECYFVTILFMWALLPNKLQ